MLEVFNRYLDYLKAERNASGYTLRNYRTDLLGTYKRGEGKGFFQFLKEQNIQDLRDVEKETVRAYLVWLVEKETHKSSIARKLSAIRSFYRYLLRESIIQKSPIPLGAAGRKGQRSSLSPKLDKRLPVFLTQPEMGLLLEAPDLSKTDGLRDRAMLEVFYATGLRVSEVWQLNLASIDAETREIRVTGKGSKDRIVLMGLPAAFALERYLSSGRGLSGVKAREQALFLNKSGRRLSMRGIQKIIKHYAEAMGIHKKVHPHIFRHTFATHMLDGGADLRVVQELLGHSDLSSTQIYTHVTKQQARKVYLQAHPLARDKENPNGS